jgi:hypothetical protein
MTKLVLYAVVCVCFAAAGCIDAAEGQHKPAVVAWLFAAANAVIFFWRP